MQHSPGFLRLVANAQSEVKEISIAAVKKMLDAGGPLPVKLIDVREDSEWAQGHLPEAVHLSKGIIERDIELRYPDLNTPMVLYCGGGFRSILATQNLQRMGYTNIVSMEGGFRTWTEQNLPVVRSDT